MTHPIPNAARDGRTQVTAPEDPTILFVKPKALKPADKKALREVGIIVVEIADPSAVKFVRAGTELSSTQLLSIAAKVIHSATYDGPKIAFGKAVAAALFTEGESP